MVINKERIYTTQELMNLILEKEYKTSSLYNKIDKLEREGVITRIGKSKYVFSTLKIFSYELESKVAKKTLKHIKENYSSDFEFTIYETTTVLNQFLNHLITKNVIILEIPRFFINHVFTSLKEGGFKNVLANPSKEDVFKYIEDNSIIIIPLVSKAPINKKNKKILIEKLAVDIICSPILNCFYEGAEIPNVLEDIFLHYKVKYDTLKNYAKRRHAFDDLMKNIPEHLEVLLND